MLTLSLALQLAQLCRRLRIPVNVVDMPNLCTFSLLATYSDGPLHVGATASSRGCKLATRLRREISTFLPPGLGNGVEAIGQVRKKILGDNKSYDLVPESIYECEDEDSLAQNHTFNSLFDPNNAESEKTRKIRWLAQICEYWPLRKLASLDSAGISAIIDTYKSTSTSDLSSTTERSEIWPTKGRIVLAGSGPGHPDLLTKATYDAIFNADIILADKLVPAPVLDLIPRRIDVFIARKFPGNAEGAQEELLEKGLNGLREGKNVLRLKQGDPYVFGRGAEEYDFFRKEGYLPIVLPGITSALSAPLFAGIPATHRGASDQVLVCTGTGRKGAAPDPPNYNTTQTVVFLMALHRAAFLVEALTAHRDVENGASEFKTPWPKSTPCAVVERASCPDQRVIRTTLEHLAQAIEEEGSRPPGLLVMGRSCEVLYGNEGKKWIVEDGFKGLDPTFTEKRLRDFAQGQEQTV